MWVNIPPPIFCLSFAFGAELTEIFMESDTSAVPAPGNSRTVFSVSELNLRVKAMLETKLPSIWVEGEVSNLSIPSSGHWYFTLKDSQAQIRCAMFRGRNRVVRFTPKNGNQVLVKGKLSLYTARGDYQLIADGMEEAGEGALRRAFDELKARLAGEGLFDDERKKSLPSLPLRVGLITSGSGAVLRDMVHVLRRRFPSIPVILFPVPVQGDEAAPAIVQAIAKANALQTAETQCDVLIVGRGGGSLEDLWAFNEEAVARAIAASSIPIISAVGHQTDFTIADFVADVRAPTPSAAAELVSPDQEEWQQTIDSYEQYFVTYMGQLIAQGQLEISSLRKRLRSPKQELQEMARRAQQLEIRLMQCLRYQLDARVQRLRSLENRVSQCKPAREIVSNRQIISALRRRLQRAIHSLHKQKAIEFNAFAQRLDSMSPLQTLARGYSITRDDKGRVVHSAAQLSIGERASVQLDKGSFSAEVIALEKAP